MPFVMLFVGIVFVVSAVRGTQDDLLLLLWSDVTGKNNFLYWVVSIILIGSLGYIPSLRTLSRLFMALVLIVLVVSKGGLFEQLSSALKSTQNVKPNANTSNTSIITPLDSTAFGTTSI